MKHRILCILIFGYLTVAMSQVTGPYPGEKQIADWVNSGIKQNEIGWSDLAEMEIRVVTQ